MLVLQVLVCQPKPSILLLHQDPRFCIHKVFERQSDKAKSIYPYITTVRDFTQLLEEDIDLVLITTPNQTHYDFAKSHISRETRYC